MPILRSKFCLPGPFFYFGFLCYRSVMFYNPLGQARDEVVSLYTDSPSVEVKDSNDVTVLSQIDPVWTGKDEVSSTKFKVGSCFLFYYTFVFRKLWQTVKTQMKCCIMLHFIRVYTVCKCIKDLQTRECFNHLLISMLLSLYSLLPKTLCIVNDRSWSCNLL